MKQTKYFIYFNSGNCIEKITWGVTGAVILAMAENISKGYADTIEYITDENGGSYQVIQELRVHSV